MSTLTHVGSDATAARLDLSGKSSGRALKDRLARVLVWSAFVVACIPLVWILASTVITAAMLLGGLVDPLAERHHLAPRRRGAAHAIQGTLMQAPVTAAMSVPIGVLTAIYPSIRSRPARQCLPSWSTSSPGSPRSSQPCSSTPSATTRF